MISLNDIFVKNLPTLDLHGTTRDIAGVLTKDFVNDNHFFKADRIVIIHGIGGGIVREAVHNELKKNKNVLSWVIHPFNNGITVIKLNI